MAVRVGDWRGSECCSVMGQISVASAFTDHITDRESGQTSPWCCTRCDLNNYGDECLVKEADRSSHRTYPTRQSGEVTDCSGTLGQWTPLARVASEPRG